MTLHTQQMYFLLKHIFLTILILFQNLIVAKPLYNSLADLTDLLEKHPRSPLIIFVRPDSNYNRHVLRTPDDTVYHYNMEKLRYPHFHVVELEKGRPKLKWNIKEKHTEKPKQTEKVSDSYNEDKIIKAKRAIGYWLQKLQIKDISILKKLKEKLTLLKNKYKQALRYACSSKYACEENSQKTEEYQQKSNREVYEYLKSNPHFRNEPKNKSKKKEHSKNDNISTRGPDSYKDQYACNEGSTKVGKQSDKTKKPKKHVTKPKKDSGSTKGYKVPGSMDNCVSNEGSTKAGPQWDETTEVPSDECNSHL